MGQSVLLVDDDADVRAMLGDFLTQHGFVVHCARDGRHALQVLAKIEAPDLILLDYNMPVMNGSQFLARKRWTPRLRGIPVVMLSAWTREWSVSRVDAAEVLSKPVDLDRLLALATGICNGSWHLRITARGAGPLARAARLAVRL